MNGIENISEQIMQDARANADKILREAEEAAALIAQEAKVRAENEIAAAKTISAVRAADIEEKGKLTASLDRKKQISSEKQKLINEAFHRALETLCGLPAERYEALLILLAVKAAGDGEGGELLLNEKDRAAYGEKVLAKANTKLSVPLTLAKDTAAIVGGVVVRRGLIELNCALDALVHMLSEESAIEVANALFGKGE